MMHWILIVSYFTSGTHHLISSIILNIYQTKEKKTQKIYIVPPSITAKPPIKLVPSFSTNTLFELIIKKVLNHHYWINEFYWMNIVYLSKAFQNFPPYVSYIYIYTYIVFDLVIYIV